MRGPVVYGQVVRRLSYLLHIAFPYPLRIVIMQDVACLGTREILVYHGVDGGLSITCCLIPAVERCQGKMISASTT